jgi:tRNA A-37 threonylcarbamoyl transferase component Bud32
VFDVETEFKGTSRFEIRRRLGAGGMGVVYEAFDRERQTPVALKTLRALDENSLYRFKNEFRSLADLRHPNLARLGELYCESGQWFFTMELVQGTSFLSYVWDREHALPPNAASPDSPTLVGKALERPRQNGRRFDEKRLRAAFAQLTSAVAALHASGKIHRDIKPSNILVTPDGRTVLLDFGLVTDLVADHQHSDVAIVGTAAYMAPEQGAGRRVGVAADWYSVGVVLYEALTGLKPFDGTAPDVVLAKQESDPPAPHTHVASVPPDLESLCMELLARDPAVRPNGGQVLARLGADVGRAPARTASAGPITAGVPFVGRQAERAALTRAFEDSRTGHGVILALHGESGLGKSALVRTFLQSLRADEPYVVVLSARCYEREELPFKAFDGIVDALSRHLSHLETVAGALMLPRDVELLARVFPVLRRIPAMAEVVESRLKVPNPQEVRTRAFAALRELLTRLAERSPLVLFVDDFQWADADSLALLRDLMHLPDAPPLFLVATVRTSAAGEAVREALSADLGDVRHLQLGPLDPKAARELVDLLLPRGSEASDAASIVDEAAGHPLFIQELVHHATSEGISAPHSIRLDEALGARIERLEPPARAFLEAVTVAAAPLPQRLIAQAAGLAEGDYTECLAQLRAAHLVRSEGSRGSDAVEPYHDRVRDAVMAHLDPETRTRHHARLALALEGAGVGEHDPRVLVRHLEGAGQPARAAKFAERAARLAAEALAFDRAAELLNNALRLGDYNQNERRDLHIQLGDVLVHAGRGAEAAAAYLAAVPGATATIRLECRRLASEQLLMSGHLEGAQEALNDVLAEIGERLPATPFGAILSLLWQRAKLRLRPLRWTPHDESEIRQRDLTRLEVYKAVGFGLALIDSVRGAEYQMRGLLLALKTGEQRRLARALCAEAVFYGAQGGRNLIRTYKMLDHATKLNEAVGGPYLAAWTVGSRGIADFFAGEYWKSIRQLREADRIMREATTGTSWEISSVRIFITFALRHLGAFNELRRAYLEYVRDAARRGDRYSETTLIRACNLVWLSQDDVAQARKDLERATWPAPVGGFLHLQHWFELRATSELDLYTGEPGVRPGFDELDGSLMARIQKVRTESRFLRGRVHLANARSPSERKAAAAAARKIARGLEREKAAYAHVWSLLLHAGAEAAEGDVDACMRTLREAVAAAEAREMLMCASSARWRLGKIIGGDEGSALVQQAGAWMKSEGIAKPERMVQVLAPGFGEERT